MTELALNWFQRDLQHIFHPCTQMKDYESIPLQQISRAKGPYLYTNDGRQIADATSSWWCKTLGHGHPIIRKAVIQQARTMEHIISAGTCSPLLVELAERLCSLVPGLDKIFYSGDGSMAVEIALKMSLQAQALRGHTEKSKFLALDGGYHGESSGALAVSSLGLYKAPYTSMLIPVDYCPVPTLELGKDDLGWASVESEWPAIESWLSLHTANVAALIIEPILQGAGGMRIYSPDFLRKLRAYTLKNNIYLIADEIMTGFGRTGQWLASQHADIIPDFICVSKGLTAGWLPFSATLFSTDIYNLFYGPPHPESSFLHSNTYSGNLLGAAAAKAAFDYYKSEDIIARGKELEKPLRRYLEEVASSSGMLGTVRALGGVVAAELKTESLKPGISRPGFELAKAALQNNLLIRPLGHTLYWLPPLNSNSSFITELAEKTVKSLLSLKA